LAGVDWNGVIVPDKEHKDHSRHWEGVDRIMILDVGKKEGSQ
jgi:hypothetical protein